MRKYLNKPHGACKSAFLDVSGMIKVKFQRIKGKGEGVEWIIRLIGLNQLMG
jgi:hypothetical protein